MAKKGDGLLEKLVPILLLASIGLAFAVGVLWQKVSQLEGGGVKVTGVNQAGTGTDTTTTTDTADLPTQGKLSADQASKLPGLKDADHLRGSKNAKVFLVEYSDFQCPYCAQFHPTAQQVMDTYGSDVAWIYRHYPLDQLHPQARAAAEASECVAELGGNDAFWKYADYVFGNQETALDDLATAAQKAGVSSSAFNNCVDAGKYKDLVENDLQEGITAGVQGTPGNFVMNANGDVWFIPGAYPFDQVKTVIDEALQG
jgi:protein-disulfide isomerase